MTELHIYEGGYDHRPSRKVSPSLYWVREGVHSTILGEPVYLLVCVCLDIHDTR